jgi:5-methyltetrahydropteroyltriglutamate--homocysteine methyltransferase
MISTVVGSYPFKKQTSKSIKNKLFKLFGGYDPYKIAIKSVVEAQLDAGIDLVSDGQVRENMVKIFAMKIPGFKIEGNTSKVVSKIQKSHKSIGADDLKFAIKVLNRKLKDNQFSENKGVKGIITGPNTIIHSSVIEKIYKNKELAIIDLAESLKFEAQSLEDAGAKVIQIDEPFLSSGIVDMNTAKEAINIISENIAIPVSIHCCGDLSNIFDKLIEFNVNIIDCEFAGHPANIKILDKYSSRLKGKKIGFGVIDTKKQEIESVDEIAKIIQKGVDIVGSENLYIDPDCGLKLFSEKIAFAKLKNMVSAMKYLQ